jgi:predicted nucleic acid-binding protein
VILVDTSVWINHFRGSSSVLAELLDQERVLVHPFVIGELACGNLANREEIIALLGALARAAKADDDEVLFFIDRHNLMGRGIGLIDVHLLASCLMSRASIWTADKRLRAAAEGLNIAFDPRADRSGV